MKENIEKMFDDDSKTKKRSANGVFSKVKSGRRGMVTASSYMTNKQQAEYAKIGEGKSYNIYSDISDFETFMRLPKDMRVKAYSNWLERFPEEYIAQVWGAESLEVMIDYLSQAGIQIGTNLGATETVQETFLAGTNIIYELDWINSLDEQIEASSFEDEDEVGPYKISNDEWRVDDWEGELEEDDKERNEVPIPLGWNIYDQPIPVSEMEPDPEFEFGINTEYKTEEINVEIHNQFTKDELCLKLEQLQSMVINAKGKEYQVVISIDEL